MAPRFDDGTLTVDVAAKYYWQDAAQVHRVVERGMPGDAVSPRSSHLDRTPTRRSNVTDQRLDPNSLLTWFECTLHARRECEEIGSGDHEVIDAGPDHVMAHRAAGRTGSTMFIHNLLADRPSRLNLAFLRDPEQKSLNFVADSDYGNDVGAVDPHDLVLEPDEGLILRLSTSGADRS